MIPKTRKLDLLTNKQAGFAAAYMLTVELFALALAIICLFRLVLKFSIVPVDVLSLSFL